jgi:hypothetical protein
MNNILRSRSSGGKAKRNSRVQRTAGLLKRLGVPKELYVRGLGQNGSLWSRDINHLQVLEQARKLYRAQIFVGHPDRGGSLERTIELNQIWFKIRKSFKIHGHELD